jgi:hypothetical protein
LFSFAAAVLIAVILLVPQAARGAPADDIVQFPDNDRARLELARAYFVLGELVRAREEFETVLRHKPPPEVEATIDRFMDSIRSQETRYRTTASFYAELGGGYDSNVNSGVGNPVISVPTLGVVQLAQIGARSADYFAPLGVSINAIAGHVLVLAGKMLRRGALLESAACASRDRRPTSRPMT